MGRDSTQNKDDMKREAEKHLSPTCGERKASAQTMNDPISISITSHFNKGEKSMHHKMLQRKNSRGIKIRSQNLFITV